MVRKIVRAKKFLDFGGEGNGDAVVGKRHGNLYHAAVAVSSQTMKSNFCPNFDMHVTACCAMQG
jgi:hypothetical protein